MINTDELRKALERPTVIINGVRHEGKILSWLQWQAWEEKLALWAAKAITATDAEADIRGFLEAAGFTQEVVDGLLGLENPIVEQVLADFFDRQRRLAKPALAEPAPPAS